MATQVIEPATDKLSTGSKDFLAQVSAVKVANKDDYGRASKLKDGGKELLSQIADTFDGLIADAYKLHKGLISKKKVFADPIEQGIKQLNKAMSAYEMEQMKIRIAEQARLAEIAKKDAEEQALREASLYEQAGQSEAAEQIIQEAIEAPPPPVVLEKFQPNEFGRSSRDIPRWEICDLSKVPMHLLSVEKNPATGLMQQISTTGIGAIARSGMELAQKQRMLGDGIKVWTEKITI